MQDVAKPVPFTLEGDEAPYMVIPDGGFEAGKTYRLWAQTCGQQAPSETYPTPRPEPEYGGGGHETPVPYATLMVVEAAEVPAALPSLQVAEPVREVVAYRGDCSSCRGPYDSINVYAELASDAGPWADALAFTTLVDDESYRPSPYYKYSTLYGKSWVGHGRDRLTAICEETRYAAPLPLAEGTHKVRFEATIPGFDLLLETNAVSFELDCEVDRPAPGDPSDRDGGTPEKNGDGGEPEPAGSDAGGHDASAGNDAHGDAGSNAGSDDARSAGGGAGSDDGGCAIARPGTDANAGLIVVLAACLALIRRRT